MIGSAASLSVSLRNRLEVLLRRDSSGIKRGFNNSRSMTTDEYGGVEDDSADASASNDYGKNLI